MTASTLDREAVRSVVDAEIAPFAGAWDREECTPREVVERVAALGWLGATLPREVGGGGCGALGLAALHEEVGRGCSSVRSLLTVHAMTAAAVARWGSARQKSRWLGRLAAGDVVAAFALSEPEVGSDASGVRAAVMEREGRVLLNGVKRWITYGQIADVFLVIARDGNGTAAYLVERDAPGLAIAPIRGMTGTRAAMLAELRFDDCELGPDARLGGSGFGLGVALSALEVGRLSVAAGSVGIVRACLEASARHATTRVQFGRPIGEHQLVRRMVADMATDARAGRLLCERAARLLDAGDPGAAHEVFIAKYFASRAATRAAGDAVQLHGALGCTTEYPVERYQRDARVMEIVEGSTQVMQLSIGKRELEMHGGV